MKKFEIKTDRFEFHFTGFCPDMTERDILNAYLEESANDPRIEASFCSLEEAKEEFAKHYSNYGTTRSQRSNSFYLLTGDIAFLEENEYDDDGEFDQGGDIWEFSAEAYTSEEVEDDEE